MQKTMLTGKLHQARVTHAELNYEGSCAIDQNFLDQSGIIEYQKIDIYNIETGGRFSTYAIVGARNSRIISLNGAAARQATIGDRIIICAYASMNEEEIATHKPNMVYLDKDNNITRTHNSIPVQQP
ncbi:MAG: aspartate 1-decarboxylase [Psychromonas sp.]|nr:aspartate 1-decarboxylase [Psychromonas sp.]